MSFSNLEKREERLGSQQLLRACLLYYLHKHTAPFWNLSNMGTKLRVRHASAKYLRDGAPRAPPSHTQDPLLIHPRACAAMIAFFHSKPTGYKHSIAAFGHRMLCSVGTKYVRMCHDHFHKLTKFVRARAAGGAGRVFKALAGLKSAEGLFLALNMTQTHSFLELIADYESLKQRLTWLASNPLDLPDWDTNPDSIMPTACTVDFVPGDAKMDTYSHGIGRALPFVTKLQQGLFHWGHRVLSALRVRNPQTKAQISRNFFDKVLQVAPGETEKLRADMRRVNIKEIELKLGRREYLRQNGHVAIEQKAKEEQETGLLVYWCGSSIPIPSPSLATLAPDTAPGT